MTEKTIDKYVKKLDRLRKDESEFDNYCFKFNPITKEDENYQNRYNIGVGLFNDLRIPEDYDLVQRLLYEEIKHRNSNSSNYDYELIYMYFYFISEFKQINDIWQFSAFKFNGTMDADSGFETGFLLSYDKDELEKELETTDNPLKEKIVNKLSHYSSEHMEELKEGYKESQIAYFDLKKPISNPLHFYQTINDKELFKIEFKKWIEANIFTNKTITYEYVQYAEFSEIKEEIINAIELYLKFDQKGVTHDKFKKRLRELKEFPEKVGLINWLIKKFIQP